MQEAALDRQAQDVLEFWFGPLDADGLAAPERAARWFAKDDRFDAMLRSRFGALHRELAEQPRPSWLATPRGTLAHVIVLDQLTRNLYRDTPAMFACDAAALEVVRASLERGDDERLAGHERGFLYLPLMHSESLADQHACVARFEAFRDASAGPLRDALENNLRFAIAHRDVVARWGRFPHRNRALGRTSTAAELEFLSRPGSSF